MNQWKWRTYIARFFHVPIFFWSISIEIKNPYNFRYLIPLFSGKNTTITVRDEGSKNIINSIGINATLIPDAVLSTDAPKKNTE
jgi:polysaccharide pyruvyl transferase WcaK-like protein